MICFFFVLIFRLLGSDQTVRLSASFLAIFDLVRNSKVFMYSFVKPLSLRKYTDN